MDGIKEYMDCERVTFCPLQQGITKPKFIKVLKTYFQDVMELKESTLTTAIAAIFVFRIPHGSSERPVYNGKYFKVADI